MRDPRTVDDLKKFITEECAAFSLEYVDKICWSQVIRRLKLVLDNEGSYIEHLL